MGHTDQMPSEQLQPIVYRVFSAAGDLLYVGAAARPDRAPMTLGPWYAQGAWITLEHHRDPAAARAAARHAVATEDPAHPEPLHAGEQPAPGEVVELAQAQQLVLAALTDVERAEGALDRAVATYRALGASWRDVGAVVGSSRQAAAKRFGERS